MRIDIDRVVVLIAEPLNCIYHGIAFSPRGTSFLPAAPQLIDTFGLIFIVAAGIGLSGTADDGTCIPHASRWCPAIDAALARRLGYAHFRTKPWSTAAVVSLGHMGLNAQEEEKQEHGKML
jgi:hypothetical protein